MSKKSKIILFVFLGAVFLVGISIFSIKEIKRQVEIKRKEQLQIDNEKFESEERQIENLMKLVRNTAKLYEEDINVVTKVIKSKINTFKDDEFSKQIDWKSYIEGEDEKTKKSFERVFLEMGGVFTIDKDNREISWEVVDYNSHHGYRIILGISSYFDEKGNSESKSKNKINNSIYVYRVDLFEE